MLASSFFCLIIRYLYFAVFYALVLDIIQILDSQGVNSMKFIYFK